MGLFEWAHADEVALNVRVDWSNPVTHDMLHNGLAEANESAYLYAIIGMFGHEWRAYYIGMVYSQDISSRHKGKDHQERLKKLKKKHPTTTWHLTLGTPTVDGKRITKKLIQKIEGLLIYTHWHDKSINNYKIYGYFGNEYIQIMNTGFTDPFYPKVGFGAFVNDD